MTTTSPEPLAGDNNLPPAETAPIPTVPETQPEATDEGNPSGEAARYRRQLRETETERDTLRETITNLQRAEVERLAAAAKLTPAAIWASGAVLADMLTDTGTVDPVKVDATIVNTRTVLGIPKLPPVPGTAGLGEGIPIGGGRTRDFASAFDPNRGRYDD